MLKRKLSYQEKQLINQLERFSINFCSPCFFGDFRDDNVKVNNGTITLIRYQGHRYGLTNYHVIDTFRERLRIEPSIKLNIGNQEVDLLDQVISESIEFDLCIISLDNFSETSFKSFGDVPTIFFDIDDFSLGSLEEGDFVVFGGYPGEWRLRPQANHLVFDTFSSGGSKVVLINEKFIKCELALHECYINMTQRNELPKIFGGLSGGPVFYRQKSSSGIETFKMVGILCEFGENLGIFDIRPISLVNEDLTIKSLNSLS